MATSTRDTLAITRFGATTRPAPSRRMPCDPVADHRQGQVEVRRRLDQPDPAAQVEVDHRRLEGRLAGAVDQVEPVRRLAAPGYRPSRSIAASTAASGSPAAPKIPSIPARPIASTISAEPMPLAIAPET